MLLYDDIAILLVVSQLLFTFFLYVSQKRLIYDAYRVRTEYYPETLLTIPCKGIDTRFSTNIESFYKLNYDRFSINFVVESESDPAFAELVRLREKFRDASKAKSVEILVAGVTTSSSQKNHNLLYSVSNSNDDIEVFAFADSDACVKGVWLEKLVAILRREKYGASSGYRWFVPTKNNFSSLALSSLNAKVAQLLGRTKLNQAWGGSMAIRRNDFYNFGIKDLWQNSISDDLSVSYAVNKNKRRVGFSPACLVASYEEINLPGLIEFARRQFIITRIALPKVWLIGLFSALYTFAGSWVALFIAIFEYNIAGEWKNPAIVSTVFFFGTIFRAIVRQSVIRKLLPENKDQLKLAGIFDVLTNPFSSIIMMLLIFSTMFGRMIVWRGVKYRLTSANNVEVLKR